MSYRDSPRGDRYDDRARYDDRERDYGRRDPDERPPPRRSYRDYDDSSSFISFLQDGCMNTAIRPNGHMVYERRDLYSNTPSQESSAD